MKKTTLRILTLIVALGLGFGLVNTVYADDEAETTPAPEETQSGGTNISLTPVSKVLQLESNSVYEDKLTVKNEGAENMEIEVYAAPYSYVYSDEDDTYRLGFNNENNFTQIVRWITFKDQGGSYVKKATYTIEPGGSLDVSYKVSTPDNIPAGGQYAVIFAHTLTGTVSANGIKTEASPGMVVYGRSMEGETIVTAEISNMLFERSVTENDTTRNNFYASAKVKNTGNVDFNASGVMRVEPIIGSASYETPAAKGHISIIPEAELVLSDEWEETPGFGLYKVTWTVTAADKTEVIERVVLVNPFLVVIIAILVLTIIAVCIIMVVKKRKERHSRLAV